jgi:hypothetical protein
MVRLLTVLFLVVGLVTLTTSAYGLSNVNGKISIHVKAHPTSCTKSYPAFLTCANIATTYASGGDIDVLPVFYDLTEYTVTETGLDWPEVDWGSGSWVKCKGDIAVGSIVHSVDAGMPAGVSGTAIAWSACQFGWGVAPGYVWLTVVTAGHICPAPNPATGDYGFVDCFPTPGPYYDRPTHVSCAGVSGMIGDDPCAYVGSESETWGGIKGIFK